LFRAQENFYYLFFIFAAVIHYKKI